MKSPGNHFWYLQFTYGYYFCSSRLYQITGPRVNGFSSLAC